jgi:AraC-like DNA-binding protein
MAVDTLHRLLITLAVRLHCFAYCEIQTGWRLVFAPMNAVTVHYVLKGSGVLRTDAGAQVSFQPNSIVIVPPGVGQTLGSARDVVSAAAEENCTLVDDGLVRFTAGDGTQDILVICGTITATYGGALGLFENLDEPLVEDFTGSNLIRDAFETLADEVTHPTFGTQVLTESVMKQCLVVVLRRHLDRFGAGSPLFAALQDQRLVRAVTAILERPASPNFVESLAALSGMSRTAFAQAFARAYGQSPLDFVRRARLRLAANLLSTTDLPVKVIAGSIRYGSRSHFSRSFRSAYGVDPKTFRRVGGYAEQEPSPVRDAVKG